MGRPITNSIMLAAFAKTTGLVSLEALNHGMASVAFRDAALEKNVEAAERAYRETQVHRTSHAESETGKETR